METINQQPTITQELPNAAMHPRTSFTSDEAMKSYYLQLAEIMNIHYLGEYSELTSIQYLQRKLRQFGNTMRFIGTHEWGQGIAEIQSTCGTYMMQKNNNQKELLKTNKEIGLHLQFIVQLASNVCFVKQLEGLLSFHYENVSYLANKLKEESNI